MPRIRRQDLRRNLVSIKLTANRLDPMLHKISSFFERRRLQRSFANPFVRPYGRDSFRYYEKGRSVTVAGELMSGRADVERVIYGQCPIKWNETGQTLIGEEREKVLQKVGEHLDQSGIKWKLRPSSD